jgi:tetratricopeptide (TPR) repeat protein/tRNA A-37 threonylcarbamoyl transferase component Bud32
MDAERWERIQALFHRAADLPAADQATLLAEECKDEPELAAEVAALLREDASGPMLLDAGLAQLADRVLGDPPSPALPHQEFGRYRIKSVLGEGGMGVVYLAERTDLGGLVAIKILRDAWLSPARRDRFANEQRTLAQLNHPAIARLYDADTLGDGTPWFVMEYVEGVPLTTYGVEHQLSVTDRLRLFRAVCEAVQYAHRHLIIHRDLKPSNILVRPDGSVVLLDFGISKQIDSLDGPANKTHTAMRFMTLAYAAPEQMRGGQSGVYTDVYSLGVVLYEMLTERLPFDVGQRSLGEAESFILNHEPVRPSAVAHRVAERAGDVARRSIVSRASWSDLDVLCLTAMHKDSQRRYRSVEALVRDVDHYLRGEPLDARPDSAHYRLTKFMTRYRRPIAAATLVVMAAIATIASYTVRLKAARDAAVAQVARTQRIQHFMLNLFSGDDNTAGPSDSLHVVTMVGRGVREARMLDDEPAVQAALYGTLGGIYQRLGNVDRADTLLRAALERQRKLSPDNADVAASLVALGLLRSEQARYDEAEQLVREGLAMSKRELPATDPAIGRQTMALGQVMDDRGSFDSAIAILDDAVRLQSRPGIDPVDLSESLNRLANSHYYVGHYALSDSLNRLGLAMDRRIYGERNPQVADDLINLGAVQHDLGHYHEAEDYLRQALSIDREWYGDDHPETASVLTILSRTLVMELRFDEAIASLQQALRIQERVYGPSHPRVASALNALGAAALGKGSLDEAQAYFTRMAAIYRSVYGDKHYLLGVAASDLGSVAAKRGDQVEAERLFREAVQRFTAAQSPTHINTGVARIKLGRALLNQGKFAEAEQESLAGYGIIAKQMSPSISWLDNARNDLVIEYDSLHMPSQAARFRTELAASPASSGPSANR